MEIPVYEDQSLIEELSTFIETGDGINNGKVYLHISPSNKVYVGITYQELIVRGGNGSGYKKCPAFGRAISKYGWCNIKHYVLLTKLSKKSAGAIETYLIQKYKSENRCYNIAKGGEGGVMPLETREKLRQAKKGCIVSEETREKIRQHNLNRSSDGHEKISNAHKKGVCQYDDDGNFIKEGDCALSVKRELNIDNSAIALCCNGKRIHAGGFKGKGTSQKDEPFSTEIEDNKKCRARERSLKAGKILQLSKENVVVKVGDCLYDVLQENPEYKKASIYKNIYGNCPSKYGFIGKKENDI